MSIFEVYLRLGFEHLLDLQGYDHILFLAALCAPHSLARWRELLILVTAFTVGHSVSLALATLSLVRADSAWVEFLIPVTIVATAGFNLVAASRSSRGQARLARPAAASRTHIQYKSRARARPDADGRASPGRSGGGRSQRSTAGKAAVAAGSSATVRRVRYLAALAFGVIHGLGFSGFLRLVLGEERSIFLPLLSFNIGLELAQIVVAGAVPALAWVASRGLRLPEVAWNVVLSTATGLMAAWMAAQRLPW